MTSSMVFTGILCTIGQLPTVLSKYANYEGLLTTLV
jgi:hypothetical protein